MSGHGGHIDPSNKKVALIIAVLAAGLAFSETLGKSAQTASLGANIEASNLWSFFQAKTIRATTLHRLSDRVEPRWLQIVSTVGALGIVDGGPIDDVDARLLTTAGERDVALLERRLIVGVVKGTLERCALNAVGGPGVAIVDGPIVETAAHFSANHELPVRVSAEIQRTGKKNAGRELDGIEHNGMPA